MDKYAKIFSEAMHGLADFFKHNKLAMGIGFAAGSIAVDTLVEFLSDVVSKKYHIYKSKEYYQEMLKAHPQLKKFKPEDVAKYFNSLNHFAPNVAKDPLAAGAYITQSLQKLSDDELGGPPPDTFNTLTDIEKKISDSRGGRNPNSIYQKILGNVATMGIPNYGDLHKN